MPFAVPPPDYHMVRSDPAAFSGYQGVKYRSGFVNEFDVTKRLVSDIRYGQTTYRLRKPATGAYSPLPLAGIGVFRVDGFPDVLIGRGAGPGMAFADWRKNFHLAFQRLFVMRPFEMGDEDRSLWTAIEALTDVPHFRESQPLIALQQGKIARARPYPQLIRWGDGTTEKVDLARMPGEFVNFRTGQHFEALVHRHPVTHKLLKVEYVKRINLEAVTEEESRRLWDSVPTSETLPDTTWD